MTKFWLALVAGAVAVTGAQAQALPPVEAFGSLPFLSQPQLSPDGKHFAGIQALDGKPAAVIYTVGSPNPPQVFASTDWTVARVNWVKNDRLVMFTKNGKPIPFGGNPELYTWYRALSLQVDGTDYVQLFDRNNDSVSVNSSTAVIIDKDIDDPDTILMPLWTRPKNTRTDNIPTIDTAGGYADYRLSIYKVNVHTGRAVILQDGNTMPGYWLTDGLGNVVGRVDLTRTPLVEHLRLYKDGSWNNARDFDARADRGANVYGLTFDAASLAVASVSAGGRDTLVRLDRATAQTGATLFEDARYDLSYALQDDWTGRVIGAAYIADKTEYVYFDPARKALQDSIARIFPGTDAHAVSVTAAGDKAIVAVEAGGQPRTLYFYDRDSHAATRFASEYPDLKPSDIGKVQPYPYKARDGLDIPAYLTLPPGRAAKNLPLIVMPHGGPDARDGIGFDWWAQFLANRGYAVFQPNYRGSKGYGRAFNEAGYHQWGLKMQDDISDGVRNLIADGIADGKRVCIVGASYGGYAALAGATFSPDLYACAVSVAGVSNLSEMLDDEFRIYGRNSQTVSFWASRIGSQSDDAARLAATSPALHADQVRVPILLMHGKLDTTVPFHQSEEEETALKRAGKNVELVTFEADDHYLNLAQTRITMLTALERFLKANIGN